MDSFRCLVSILISPAFVCLTGVAFLSTLSPLFRELASHGKNRTSNNREKSAKTSDDVVSTTKQKKWSSKTKASQRQWQHFLLQGDSVLISKRYFLHFYIVGLASLALFLYTNTVNTNKLQASLLASHLGRRYCECLYVHRCSEKSKMHLAGYICGIFHYLFLPFMMFDIGCCYLGTDQNVFDNNQQQETSERNGKAFQQVMCCVLCLWGQREQYLHHCILSNLRPATDDHQNSKEKNYKLPQGRWFQFVSCPHYLAEIIIYASFFLMCTNSSNGDETSTSPANTNSDQCSNTLFGGILKEAILSSVLIALWQRRHFVLLLWVSCNLTVTALRSHQWYNQQFPCSYEMLQRKAIIPFVL